MSRRKLAYLLSGLVAVGLAAAAAGWYHVVTRPDYQLREGEEALERGDFQQAERSVRRLEADGHAAEAHLLRGETYLRRHDNARAVAEFRQVPRDRDDLFLKAAPHYGEAVLPINLYEAEGAFLYVLSKRPDDVAAHRGLAEIYRRQQALLRARTHLLALTRLDPDDGSAYLHLGEIDITYEKFDEGRDHLEQALRRTLSPRDAEKARQALANCLFERRDYGGVLKVLESCQPATRQDPEMQRLEVEALRAQGDGAGARRVLERALAAHPQDVNLLRLRAHFHLDDREPALAVALLQKALAINPYDRECHHELGNAYQRLGQSEKARNEFDRAKEIGDRLTAIDQLSREALKNPWNAEVRRRLAVRLRELGRDDMARAWEQSAAACPQGSDTASP